MLCVLQLHAYVLYVFMIPARLRSNNFDVLIFSDPPDGVTVEGPTRVTQGKTVNCKIFEITQLQYFDLTFRFENCLKLINFNQNMKKVSFRCTSSPAFPAPSLQWKVFLFMLILIFFWIFIHCFHPPEKLHLKIFVQMLSF